MSLLETYINIFSLFKPAFSEKRTFHRALEHSIGWLTALGRKTVTCLLTWWGKTDQDWSADYKLYSRSKWQVNQLFDVILARALSLNKSKYISVAVDDTVKKKTGKCIPGAGWCRDPLSPHYRPNLIHGLRFLQFAIVTSIPNLPSKTVPIRWTSVLNFKKPRKKAAKKEWDKYRALQKKHNLTTQFISDAQELRLAMDKAGGIAKLLIIAGDSHFCNRFCLKAPIKDTVILARSRKNASLRLRDTTGSHRRFYSKEKFTPQQVRLDKTIPWKCLKIRYGSKKRLIRYKEIKEVFWQSTQRTPLRLIVIAPTPYHKGRRLQYRQEAYLLTNASPEVPIKVLIQAYFDRWQIEVNHKEEKSILGVGQAQLWNENSVARQPAFEVVSYSALLLASIEAHGGQTPPSVAQTRAKWYRYHGRASCRELVQELRRNLIDEPELIQKHNLQPPTIYAILKAAA